MKKIILVALTICTLTLCACASQAGQESADTVSVPETVTSVSETENVTESLAEASVEASVEEVKEPEIEEPEMEEPEADPAKENVEAVATTGYEPGDLFFETVDIYGNPVTDEVIWGSKLVLMNLWEPWCGPCVREMPDLELLYEKYKDQGLLILGVYTSFDMDEDAKDVLDYCGTTYPILKCDSYLYAYEQDYVPATFIFDGNGYLLDSEPIPGSQSYEEWEEIILEYLK